MARSARGSCRELTKLSPNGVTRILRTLVVFQHRASTSTAHWASGLRRLVLQQQLVVGVSALLGAIGAVLLDILRRPVLVIVGRPPFWVDAVGAAGVLPAGRSSSVPLQKISPAPAGAPGRAALMTRPRVCVAPLGW